MPFLPLTTEEFNTLGWDRPDIVLVTGDAYVDHPSFGIAIIGRVLEAAGHHVAIVAQPQCEEDYTKFGTPRLGFFVSSGNVDSMVANYTAAKRRRNDDPYTPGGKAGVRPDRALTVYCKAIRKIYGDIPLVIGGLEASLRRFAHYDYWTDSVFPSIIIDTSADLLIYGMGETAVTEIANRLQGGEPVSGIHDVRGTVYAVPVSEYQPTSCAQCPSFKAVSGRDEVSLREYAVSARIQYQEQDSVRGKPIIQRHGDRMVVQNSPQQPLNGKELDAVYELPYMRAAHPSYGGTVASINEVKFSITHTRGCYGACSFCALAFHQGRRVTTRSADSVVKEAQLIAEMPDFKGYIHDIGGPTANFRGPACDKQEKAGVCRDRRCLTPTPCPALKTYHDDYLSLLRRVRKIPGIKKVFIRSGIRYDYLMADPGGGEFFRELVTEHVSGQLKVAPEHCSDLVLGYMGKPSFEVYRKFQKRFYELTKSVDKKQYLVPYLMSSHPGSTLQAAIELSLFLKDERLHPEQVQDFYPTPGTLSTAMYHTGLDPMTLKSVYVPKTKEEKAQQRALLQYFKPENRAVVTAALKKAGRSDLIGSSPECLVPASKETAKSRTAPIGKPQKDSKLKPDRYSSRGGQRPGNDSKNGRKKRR